MRALWRRKWLSLVGLLMTVGLGVGAATAVGPSYTAQAIVTLIPPPPDQGVKNPYLYLAGLNQARDIAERSLSSEQVQDRLKRADARASYTVTEDPMSAGPLMIITAEAPTSDQVTKTLTALLDSVAPTMRRLQDQLHISPAAQIKTLEVTRDAKPTPVHKTQMRAAIVVTALGLGMTLLVVALVDGLLARRTRKAAGAPGAEPADQANRAPVPRRPPGEVDGRQPRRDVPRPDPPGRPDPQSNGRPEQPQSNGRPLAHPGGRPARPPRPKDRGGQAKAVRGELRK